MVTSFRIHLLITALWLPGFCLAAKRQPPKVYENSKAFSCSCADIWAVIPSVAAKHGFMPESSDRAGGFMKLKWIKGESARGNAGKDIKLLTLEQPGALTTYKWFRVVGASLSATESATGCQALLQIEYNANKSSVLGQTGWIVTPSNGLLESIILEDVATTIKK